MKVDITLIPKADIRHQKGELQAIISEGHRCNSMQQNTRKSNPAGYQKDHMA